jgi:hypothetical protein
MWVEPVEEAIMSARVFVKVAFVLMIWACLSLPAMAQGVGAFGGTITDASGAVVPGVTVTLSNPGTIGGNQEAVTDARGTYQFTRLVPGRYSVKAEVQGFRPAIQENIIVNADVTVRVDLKLEVGELSEGIIVKGEAPLLDTTSALNQTVMSRELLDTLPNRSDVWSIARVVPGVILSKYDVGGSESFLQSPTAVHGSTTDENAYMIDGMDVSYTGGTGGVAIVYFDPYMFQEANYQTANGPAERAKAGIIYNMISKTGTNTLHGSFMFTGANHGMGFNNVSPALRKQLLASVPARALAANPKIVPGADIQNIFDIGGTLGGPILPNKLWFTTSLKHNLLNQYRLGSYEPTGAQVLDDNLMSNVAFKISWQTNGNSQLSYLYNWHNKLIGHRTGSTEFFENRALWFNNKYPTVHQAKWTTTLSSKMVVDVAGSLMHGVDPFHQEPGVQPGDIPRYDSVLKNHTVANTNYYDNPGYRGVVLSSLTYVAGTHEVKVGYQYMRVMIGQNQDAVSQYLPGIQAVYRNGVPDSVNTYTTPANYKLYDQENAAFIQDKWRLGRRLTLNVGLRFETISGWEPATCRVQTVFVQAQCFPAITGAPDWNNLAPRSSVVYDIFGTGKTALKLSANRYDNSIGVANVGRINPISITSDTRLWVDADGDGIPQLNELGPSTGFNLGAANHYSSTLKRPYTNELSVEVEHQLPGDLVVSVGYYYRGTRRIIGSRNLAVPMDSYIPLQVTEATSLRQVTVYNQDPSLRGKFNVTWDNVPQLNTDFNGVDATFNKRLSHGWMLMGGLSLGRNIGDIYGTSDLNDPNFTFRRGVIGDQVPVAIKASGVYQLPFGITLSASAQHFTGFPENTIVLISSNTVTLTRVSQSLLVEPRATTRLPSVNLADLSLRKTFKIHEFSVEPVMDMYNLGNAATTLARITQLGPTYGQAGSILRARLIKLGVNVDF